ncbi:MAG: hypothetical protein GF313_15200 [Caldithrix sp.]|nr:hypothetical protein [Caldithrix sp.]
MGNLFEFFKHNYKPIIFSFLLALLLWVVVTMDKQYTIKIEIPFKIENVAPGYVLMEKPPATVTLEIRGKGRALLALNFYKQEINLALQDVNQDTLIYLDNYRQQFTVVSKLGVDILDIIDPKKINLKVDKLAEVKKPVQVQKEIKVQMGYLLMDIQLYPDSVFLKGPSKIVNKQRVVKTEPIRRDEVKYPFQKRVNLVNPVPGIVKIKPQQVNAKFKIEQLVERKLYNVPIQLIGVPDRLIATAIPDGVTLKIKGGEEVITQMQPEQITVYFDYRKNYRKGKMEYSFNVETPEDVKVVSTQPEKFHLKLERKEL